MLTDTIEPPNDDAMESDDEPRHQLRPPINPMPNSRSDAIPSTLIPRGEEGEGGEVGEAHQTRESLSPEYTRGSTRGAGVQGEGIGEACGGLLAQ